MKGKLCFAVGIILLTCAGGLLLVAHARTNRSQQLIELTADRTNASICEPITLHTAINNSTPDTLTLRDFFDSPNFVVHVRDSAGREVPLTRRGADLMTPRAGSEENVAIPPNTRRYEMDNIRHLNNIYDMTAPGTYSISTTTTVLAGQRPLKLTSNVLQVTVDDDFDARTSCGRD
jgi:hypothetical protein